MIGSGASGLAAAVSAERAGARVGLATKGSIQACNSAKAQGGIQAVVRRRRLARAARGRRLQELPRQRRHAARRVLTGDAPSAIHWLEELGVEFTRENGAIAWRAAAARLRSGCSRWATARHAITKALRDAFEAGGGTLFANSPFARSSRGRTAGAPTCGEHELDAATVILAAGGRCFKVAEERGELSTNHPAATGEVTRDRPRPGAEARDLDPLQYHPNGGAWPETMQGYSIPETTRAYGAVLLNADREEFTDSLGPRDESARPSSTRSRKERASRPPDGRPAVYLDTTRISEADAEVSLP